MTENEQHQPVQRERPAQHTANEKAIREGAWQVVQQGAQVFAELGGGAAGFATAAHLAKGLISGTKPSGNTEQTSHGSETSGSDE